MKWADDTIKAQQRRDYWHMVVGIMIGGLLTAAGALIPYRTSSDVTEQDRSEYAAYRDCLANAGRVSCKMTPDHFVRYYELKRKLEQVNGRQEGSQSPNPD